MFEVEGGQLHKYIIHARMILCLTLVNAVNHISKNHEKAGLILAPNRQKTTNRNNHENPVHLKIVVEMRK